MTLAPARPTSTPSAADGVEPSVTAVVITRRDARGLAALLEAVLDQSLAPDAVIVLDRSAGAAIPAADAEEAAEHPVTDDHVTLDQGSVTVAGVVDTARRTHAVPVTPLPVDPRTPARAAAHRALLDPEVDVPPTTLAWLLPVGTTPEPGALVALVDTWRRSPSAGVVGPKHLDASDPHLLRALAIRTTRGGRLLSRPRPGEPDQGQYDRSTDALGVPFAGSLVERDLLTTLRGWEASFGDVGADLDLGWRAHNAGRRVVVVPGARMRTEPGVAPAGASTAGRRRSARRVALARSPWWASPFLAAWIAVTSVVAALGLLLLKRPRAAGAELSSLASLDPFRGTAARWRTRHRREVSRRDLRALFEPRRAVLTGWGDAVHDALVPPRPPIGDEANDLNPRSWVLGVLRHPGVLATAGALLVSAVAGRSVGVGVVTGAGSGLAGGELMGTRADATVLWHAWTDGWTGPGLGGPDPVGPWAPLLALPTWLVDHVPLLPSPGSAAGLVVAVIVIAGMPIAAVSAYLALRPVVVTRWVRGLAAFGWATTGVAATSVAQGRLGALVALILLPPIAGGLWLLAVRRSTATSAFATALAALLLGAFAPVLLALVTALALVLALARSGARRHALVVAVVPVAVLAPWLVRQAEASWPVLVAGLGLAQWGGPTPEPWQLALLNPGGPGAPLVWTAAPLVAVAVLAMLRGRGWGGATTTLAVLAPVLLALALVAPGIRLGTVPAGVSGAGEPITLWSGTLLLPLALVLVLALARGLDGVRLRRPASAARLPALARRTGALFGVAAVAASADGVAWATLGTELAPWQDPRPAVSVDQAEGAFATRALFVVPGTRGAGYRFVGREASEVARALPSVDRADGSLADRVSAALGDASTGPSLFADTATDLLAVRSGLVPEVARRLDATDGLQPIAPRDGWDMWRVSPIGTGVDLVAPPRLRLQTPGGTRLVSTTGQSAATRTTVDVPSGSRLVVAEPLGWAQHAVVSVDGVTVEPVPGTPTPTYLLPVGTGRLVVDVTDPARWWHVGQALAVLALAFLAVPFGRRVSRVGQA
jgi:GT2 family glycosyltransferase